MRPAFPTMLASWWVGVGGELPHLELRPRVVRVRVCLPPELPALPHGHAVLVTVITCVTVTCHDTC